MSVALQPAAHVGHPIVHSSNTWGWVGFGLGVALGAAAIFFTAGLAAPLVIGVAAAGAGSAVGDRLSKGKVVKGGILDGARTVFMSPESRRAAMADKRTLVSCHRPQFVCRGSKTVFIENKNASRKKDGTSCGGEIARGNKTIHVGGQSVALPGFEHVAENRGAAHRWRGYGLLAVGIIVSVPAMGASLGAWALWAAAASTGVYGATDLVGARWAGIISNLFGIRGAVRGGGRATRRGDKIGHGIVGGAEGGSAVERGTR